MVGQAPLAPSLVAPMVSNQATTAVKPQVVPQSLPPAIFLAHAPLVPNPHDQQVYNPFLHERNYVQAPLDHSKHCQSIMKFELPEFKGNYGTDKVLDWIQIAEQVLRSVGVPHACVKVVMSRLLNTATVWWRDPYAFNVNTKVNYKLLLGVIFICS